MDARASGTPYIHISPTRSPTRRPFTTVGVGKGSAPTSPNLSKLPWPNLMKRGMAETHLGPFMAYATPSFNPWKKFAKNAELELHLEQDSHRADNAKNNTIIHRCNRRLIPLERALGKARETLKHQEKLINFLRSQLMGIDEKKNVELSHLHGQSDAMQKTMGGAAQKYEQKIIQLQEELHKAKSRVGTLQAQMHEIYRNVDDTTPRTTDGSGSTRASTPASLKHGTSTSTGTSDTKDVQKSNGNKQDVGLVALAKIHRMHLSKEDLKAKLKDSEQRIVQLQHENEKLRTLTREAVNRSNKFLDLAQTLKVDRDLTMSRLKETEEIIQSLEALNDFIHSYSKTTSPRGNILCGPQHLYKKSLYLRQGSPPLEKTPGDSSQLERTTIDPGTMRSGPKARVVYYKGEEVATVARNTGASLLKKLQDVFQALASKVETANQTAKMVKQEREEIRLMMLEAFQLLRGQKGSKLNAADDVALGVLMAVKDVKEKLEGLTKERDVEKASKYKEDEKVAQLESRIHDLTMDRLALLETIELVKNAIKSSHAGHGIAQYVKGLFHRNVVERENISEVLEMVEKLISERNEAKSISGGLKDEKLLKEKELNDLKKLYAQSQTLTAHLQVEKDMLRKEKNELKALTEDLRNKHRSWDTEKKEENDKKILALQSQVHDLSLDRAALLETLKAMKNEVKASRPGHGSSQHLKGFLKRSTVAGEDVSEVVELVEELVLERDEARQGESRVTHEKEKVERKLHDIETLYNHSQDLHKNLNAEKDALQHQLNEIEKSVDALKTEKDLLNASSADAKRKLSELETELHSWTHDRATPLETLKALKHILTNADSTAEGLITRSAGESSDVLETAKKIVRERCEGRSGGRQLEEENKIKDKELLKLKHQNALLESSCVSLESTKDELEREVRDLRKTFRSIEGSICEVSSEESHSFDGIDPLKSGSGGINSGSNFSVQFNKLAKVVEAVETLKREKAELLERVTSAELQKELAVRRSSEHEDKMLKLANSSQQEVAEMRNQLNSVHSLVAMISREGTPVYDRPSADTNDEQAVKPDSPLAALEGIKTEILALRTAKSELEVNLTALLTKEGLEQKKLHELTYKLSLAESQLKTMSERASIADSMENRTAIAEAQLSDLATKLTTAESHVQELSVRASIAGSLERRNVIIEAELLDLSKELASSQAQVQTLSLRASAADCLERRNAIVEAELSDFSKKLASSEAQLQTLSVRATAADSLERRNAIVEAEFSDLSKKLASSEAQLQTSSERATAADSIQRRNAIVEAELSDLLKKLASSEAQLQTLSERANAADSLVRRNAIVEAELSDLSKKLASSEAQLQTLSERANAADSLVRRNAIVEAELSDLSKKLASSEAQLQTLSVRASTADSLESLHEAAKSQLSGLASRLASAETELKDLSLRASVADTLDSQCAAAEARSFDLASKLASAELQLQTLSQRASAADSLESQHAAVEAQLSGVASKLALAEEQIQTLSARASVADSLENRSAAVEAQLSELFDKIQSKDLAQESDVPGSSMDVDGTKMDISEKIEVIQSKFLELLRSAKVEDSKRANESIKLKEQLGAADRDTKVAYAELDRLKEKSNGQTEFIKKQAAEWTRAVEILKGEITRLGGIDPKDEGEKLRRATAAAKVKELVSAALSRNPPSAQPQTSTGAFTSSNPLLSFGKFHVDLLVNNKVHSQLKVAGYSGGLSQAVLRYFVVDATTGEVIFENAAVPGSQSSNLIVDLLLLPADKQKEYQAQARDTLGLSVKVLDYNQGSPREVLFNANVIRTDEVMEAIRGQTIQNFSLWPDLVSSWRWELEPKKNKWRLISVRWRFLLKNIFPELSAPLQDLTIKVASTARSTSVHIK